MSGNPEPAQKRFRLLRRPTDSIRPATPRPQRRDCQGQLLAALQALDGSMSIDDASMRPWCSATFVGAQHRIALRLAGEAGPFAERLKTADFALRGHIVADVSVDEIREGSDHETMISLSVLTIEDW